MNSTPSSKKILSSLEFHVNKFSIISMWRKNISSHIFPTLLLTAAVFLVMRCNTSPMHTSHSALPHPSAQPLPNHSVRRLTSGTRLACGWMWAALPQREDTEGIFKISIRLSKGEVDTWNFSRVFAVERSPFSHTVEANLQQSAQEITRITAKTFQDEKGGL